MKRYLSKISGPLLDRMDIQVEVASIDYDDLRISSSQEESSETIKKRVDAARAYARARFEEGGDHIRKNGDMTAREIEKYCHLSDEASTLLKAAFEKLGMSARGYSKILKLARTIADLELCEVIGPGHIAEAISLRSLDKKYFNE